MAEFTQFSTAITKAEWERLMQGRTRNLTDGLPSVKRNHLPSQEGRAAANRSTTPKRKRNRK